MPTRLAELAASAPAPTSVVRRAVGWFLFWSLLALVVLGIGSIVVANELAKDSALRDARIGGAAFGRTVAAPLVDAGVRSGETAEQSLLDSVMRNRLRDGSIVHIKLWSADQRIIWADENGLAGRRFALTPPVRKLFGTNGEVAEFSPLTDDENVLERGERPLLEVYVGVRDADGRPFVFESYWSTSHIHDDQTAIERRLLPLVLGALVLFELAVLPLALSLARRVDRFQAERGAMRYHALASADKERRRIAQDLHDGLLQDLSGLGYALPAIGAQLPPEAHRARRALVDAAAVVRRDVTTLRSLLTDVYPADLKRGGLGEAVAALAHRAGEAGLAVDVHLDGLGSDATGQVAQVSYQVIREGLRNVLKHAQATRAEVRGSVEAGTVTVAVLDDGKGPDQDTSAPGHLGLRLLEDALGTVGGRLVLEPRETGGAALTATFPWAGADGDRSA